MSTSTCCTLEALLSALPLLREVPREDLERLPISCVERARGETFFLQDEPSEFVFGVKTGRVRVVKQAASGREVCLELLGPGDVLAAIAVLRKIPYPANAVASEATACIRIPGDAFRWLVERHPWINTRILEIVSQRLLEAGESRLSLATEPVETRLAQALLRMAEKYAVRQNGRLVFGCALTRNQLAELAGTTVETAIRVMSAWTREGIVRSTASRITVLHPETLERLAGRTRPTACGAHAR